MLQNPLLHVEQYAWLFNSMFTIGKYPFILKDINSSMLLEMCWLRQDYYVKNEQVFSITDWFADQLDADSVLRVYDKLSTVYQFICNIEQVSPQYFQSEKKHTIYIAMLEVRRVYEKKIHNAISLFAVSNSTSQESENQKSPTMLQKVWRRVCQSLLSLFRNQKDSSVTTLDPTSVLRSFTGNFSTIYLLRGTQDFPEFIQNYRTFFVSIITYVLQHDQFSLYQLFGVVLKNILSYFWKSALGEMIVSEIMAVPDIEKLLRHKIILFVNDYRAQDKKDITSLVQRNMDFYQGSRITEHTSFILLLKTRILGEVLEDNLSDSPEAKSFRQLVERILEEVCVESLHDALVKKHIQIDSDAADPTQKETMSTEITQTVVNIFGHISKNRLSAYYLRDFLTQYPQYWQHALKSQFENIPGLKFYEWSKEIDFTVSYLNNIFDVIEDLWIPSLFAEFNACLHEFMNKPAAKKIPGLSNALTPLRQRLSREMRSLIRQV